jgi:hypothetical protein
LLVIDVWGIGKSWEIWIKKGKFLEYQPRVGDNSNWFLIEGRHHG